MLKPPKTTPKFPEQAEKYRALLSRGNLDIEQASARLGMKFDTFRRYAKGYYQAPQQVTQSLVLLVDKITDEHTVKDRLDSLQLIDEPRKATYGPIRSKPIPECDVVEMINGNEYRGELMTVTPTSIEIETEDAGRLKLPRGKAKTIHFSQRAK
jgi:hypothetical protein